MNPVEVKIEPPASAPPYPEGPSQSTIPVIAAGEQPPSYEATAAAPNTLPPTYQSLYGEFRQVDDPKSLAQFLGKAFTAIINTVTAAVTLAFLNIIPLFMIILGSINVHHCSIQPLIPIWLIVSGSALLLKSAVNFVRMKLTSSKRNRSTPPEQEVPKGCKNPFKVVLTLLGLFTVVWFVIGSVWVYSAYSDVDHEKRESPNYCDQFTYVFSFVYATFGYISTALAVCCFCCCCCCICFRSKERHDH